MIKPNLTKQLSKKSKDRLNKRLKDERNNGLEDNKTNYKERSDLSILYSLHSNSRHLIRLGQKALSNLRSGSSIMLQQKSSCKKLLSLILCQNAFSIM